MEKIQKFIDTVTTAWVGIGSFLMSLASSGFLTLPEGFQAIFGIEGAALLDASLQAVVVAIGAVITYFQFIRNAFAKKEAEKVEGEVSVLSAKAKKSFALNPFGSL